MAGPQISAIIGDRPVVVWLVAFLGLFAVLATWSLASPLYSGPDEPAHVVQAAALARGEVLGTPVGGPASPTTAVVVPAYLKDANALPGCFNGRDSVPASCEPSLPTGSGSITETTYTGRYPPLYGFIVGWPTLVTSGSLALRLMRLSGAAVCAVLLAGGAWCALRARRRFGLLLGLGLSITPQVLFLGGVVNPSGMEISAAICVWTAGLVVAEQLHAGRGLHDRAALAWLVVAAALMANSRGLSPFLLGLIGVVLLVVAGRRGVVAFFRTRSGRVATAVVVGASAVAVIWIFGAGALRVLPSHEAGPVGGLWSTLVATTDNVASMVPQYLGVFGWVDTPLPLPLYVVGLTALASAVVVGLVRADRHQRGVILLALGLCVAVPILVTLSQASRLGDFGQARDWMPLWVGLPLVSTRVLGDGAGIARRARLLIAAGAAALAFQVLSWFRLLDRFRFGLDVSGAPPWDPPVPVAALLALLLVGLAVGAWLAWAALADRPALLDDLAAVAGQPMARDEALAMRGAQAIGQTPADSPPRSGA